MRLFGLGVPELVVIVAIVLLIFGPKQLPKLGSAIGKSIKGLRSGMKEVQEEVGDAADLNDSDEQEEEEEGGEKSGEETERPAKKVRKVVSKKADE